MNHLAAAGTLVNAGNTISLPGETASENRPLVNFCDTNPAGDPLRTPHRGQPGLHPSLVGVHELYESTKQSLRRSIDLGKRGRTADSCTTGTRIMRPGRIILGGEAHLADSALRTTTAPLTMCRHPPIQVEALDAERPQLQQGPVIGEAEVPGISAQWVSELQPGAPQQHRHGEVFAVGG